VIASHYAKPLERRLKSPAALLVAPSGDAAVLGQLNAGDRFEMLEDSVGWAWGYGGADRKVGYVPSDALD
jgi:hypothetical protein